MPGGFATTAKLLADTNNEAASSLLVSALDVKERDIREQALGALLSRRSDSAARDVLQRWNDLSDRCRTQIAHRAGWLSGAIRAALQEEDLHSHQCACAAAVFTRDFDLTPVFVTAATDRFNRHAALAAAATLELAELLSEEVAGPRDYRIRRDPKLQQNHVLPSLERALATLANHNRGELLEAFVLLANRENAVLKGLLQSPAERGFQALAELLESSSRPVAMRLLLSYLDDPHAPLAAIHIIGQRSDVSFLRHLARKVGAEPSPTARTNLRRVDSFPWITGNLQVLSALNEAEQAGAVQLVVHSSAKRHLVYQVLAYLLQNGAVAGRQAAAKALAEFSGVEVNDLVVRKLEDDDPQVRASLAGQLRQRGIPDAIQRLIPLLESPHAIERQTAQACLEEFQFHHFAANFDQLTPAARLTTGRLVRRIDPQSISAVRSELEASSRGRRKRALEMVVPLGAVLELHGAVAALLDDEDPFLRMDAIGVLATIDCDATRQILRDALLDSHPLVQEAAEAALARFTLVASSPMAVATLQMQEARA